MGTLSYSYGKPYGYRFNLDTCRWCGDRLPRQSPGDERGGYRDNGYFCSLRCGYQWAVRRIKGLDG